MSDFVWDIVPETLATCRDLPGMDPVPLDLSCLGPGLRFRLFHDRAPAGLASLVPYAHTLADILIEDALARRTDLTGLPCSPGCDACCSFLVPLSIPEAIHLVRGIQAGTIAQPTALEAFRRQSDEIHARFAPDHAVHTHAAHDAAPRQTLIEQHIQEACVTCPLLHDHACQIYLDRPLACRNFFEAGSAENCAPGQVRSDTKFSPTLSLVQVLCKVAALMEGRPMEAVLLPLAPKWLASNPQRAAKTWPTDQLLSAFASICHDHAVNAVHAA